MKLTTKEMSRIFSKIVINPNSCWEYRVGMKDGYGRVFFRGKRYQAHRFFYELYYGYIPQYTRVGKEIDHLCKNRCCVNIKHLELIDKGIHTLRGNCPSAINKRKIRCPRGHPYTQRFVKNRGKVRVCVTCLANYENNKHRIEYKKKYSREYYLKHIKLHSP